MSDLVEVLMTSDENASQWSCSAWDPRNSTNVMFYKGGGAAALHSFSMIKNQFIVTANSTKPLIHIWPTNSQEQINGIRLVTPGKVNALAVSSDGKFLIAGIQEIIYIWRICSGKMLNVLSKHFQNITTIKFTDDNSHFITAGQDGSVLIWNLTRAAAGDLLPKYSLNDHSLPVTDFHIGHGGARSILCTISLDRSCRLYNFVTGEMLLCIVSDEGLTAVCMPTLENYIFVGTVTGLIYCIDLDTPPRMKEYHMDKNDYEKYLFGQKGNSITCLDLSLDGKTLASGDKDKNVCLWDIASKQLLRTLLHTAPITNLKFILCGKDMFNPEINFNLIISNIKRMKDNVETEEEDIIEVFIPYNSKDDDNDSENFTENSEVSNNLGIKSSDHFEELKKLKEENEELRKINRSLYKFSVNKILSKNNTILNGQK